MSAGVIRSECKGNVKGTSQSSRSTTARVSFCPVSKSTCLCVLPSYLIPSVLKHFERVKKKNPQSHLMRLFIQILSGNVYASWVGSERVLC